MSSSSAQSVAEAVHKLQLRLLEGINSETQLMAAASLLSKSDYQDVVTERSISGLCGYPLCPNSLPSPSDESLKKGRYRISLKEHKVYDLLETRMYCSTKCVVDSRTYAASLEEERSSSLDGANIDKVVRLFEGLSLNGEVGLGKNGSLGLSELKIQEKEDVGDGGGVVPMEEWIGPSNAIEGYVPQNDSNSKNRKTGTRSDVKLKRGEENLFKDVDFMSTIITQENEYTISKNPSVQTKEFQNSKSKDLKKKVNRKGTDDQLTILAASSTHALSRPETCLKELNGKKSETVSNYEQGVPEVLSDVNVVERKMESCGGKESQSRSTVVKSSLKSSVTTRTNRSVTWADEKTDGACNQTLCEFSEVENEKEATKGFGISDMGNDNADDAFRLASAEACALALSQAAEDVASGEFDVPNAVSDAGLIILPPSLDDNEVRSEESVDTIDPEPAPVKWPKRAGISESDFFESEDSWYDSPPEGFNLDLSPFATIFMHLFAWTSSSSLAYIYGCDDSAHEEYASINGREYLRKTVSTDGWSPEIKQTLAGCLARALPEVASVLRLPTPISILEQGMGFLLETMSFLDPLPPLRTKQWQVVALLFIDALSVCRIPALAPHMTERRRFFQKVFDGAQISAEEYEVMKDLLIPQGRVPQYASQKGG